MRRFTCVLAILCLWLLSAPLSAQEKPAAKAPAAKAPAAKVPAAKAAPTAAAPLNLNSATAAQIATLPGIGPKAAQRIVEDPYQEQRLQEN